MIGLVYFKIGKIIFNFDILQLKIRRWRDGLTSSSDHSLFITQSGPGLEMNHLNFIGERFLLQKLDHKVLVIKFQFPSNELDKFLDLKL